MKYILYKSKWKLILDIENYVGDWKYRTSNSIKMILTNRNRELKNLSQTEILKENLYRNHIRLNNIS